MTRLKLLPTVRKVGRTALFILIGCPHLLILIAVCVGLTIHAVRAWLIPGASVGWSPGELIRGVGFQVGLILLAAFATAYLLALVYVGMKGHAGLYRRGSWEAVGRPWIQAVITRDGLRERIDALAATHKLVGPVRREEPRCSPPRRWFYESVARADELDLAFDYCVYGPKATLMPPRETLLRYDAQTRRFEATAVVDAPRIAIVGVHPCDLHSIALLDDVFARDQHDRHYLDRRASALIIGVDCPSTCDSGAFCRDMGSDSASSGFDIMLYPLPASGDGNPVGTRSAADYGVIFGTEAGRKWLAAAENGSLRDPTFDDERRFERYLEHKATAFQKRLRVKGPELPCLLAGSYDSLVWAATALRCYSCGSCTLTCPTCYCFDIQDETELAGGKGTRERTWDSCMLRDFALVAGGHNFRSKAAQRLRHRIYRKGSWIEHRTGMSGCVGCARCTRACTAHISIVDIFNQLADERQKTAVASLPGTAPAGGGNGR
ncbi:MAG: 4Fe-4S dicluster domain-containing protein [Phycisphaerales bacterium]|nr:4Fe-4S dicluster domain-containing protein [Phycisphaerales bacterium]